jgi:hypothetical protein
MCEIESNAAWTTEWMVDGVSVTPYDPNADDPTPEDLGNRCVDFGAGTPFPIPAGGTVEFEVNNVPPPGGAPRTPGYWKNWTLCDGNGNQHITATRNAGYMGDPSDPEASAARIAEGFFLLDDLLPLTIGDFEVTTCEVGVDILDTRQNTDPLVVGEGKQKANDGAYRLGRNLLATKLNLAADACYPDGLLIDTSLGLLTLNDVIDEADALLTAEGFDGTAGSYIKPGGSPANRALRALALELAGILDDYNNGAFCGDTDGA